MGGPKGQAQTLQDPNIIQPHCTNRRFLQFEYFERIRGYVSSIPLTKRGLPASSTPGIALHSPSPLLPTVRPPPTPPPCFPRHFLPDPNFLLAVNNSERGRPRDPRNNGGHGNSVLQAAMCSARLRPARVPWGGRGVCGPGSTDLRAIWGLQPPGASQLGTVCAILPCGSHRVWPPMDGPNRFGSNYDRFSVPFR